MSEKVYNVKASNGSQVYASCIGFRQHVKDFMRENIDTADCFTVETYGNFRVFLFHYSCGWISAASRIDAEHAWFKLGQQLAAGSVA